MLQLYYVNSFLNDKQEISIVKRRVQQQRWIRYHPILNETNIRKNTVEASLRHSKKDEKSLNGNLKPIMLPITSLIVTQIPVFSREQTSCCCSKKKLYLPNNSW